MSKNNSQTQKDLVLEFFKNNPNRDISHPEVVDWLTEKYKERRGKIFRDPDRQIRSLHQRGILKKIANGVYRYDPEDAKEKEFKDFSPVVKKKIFEHDGYRCVICGKGLKEGVSLHADHIKPRELGGESILENGQTLCGPHNMLKKTIKQTETGKKMFIRLYELAKKERSSELVKFTSEILEVFEKNNMNGHIVWKK